jgi:hypothetical protein
VVADEREAEKDDDSEGHEHEKRYASAAENSGGWAYKAGSKTLTRRSSHDTQLLGWPTTGSEESRPKSQAERVNRSRAPRG